MEKTSPIHNDSIHHDAGPIDADSSSADHHGVDSTSPPPNSTEGDQPEVATPEVGNQVAASARLLIDSDIAQPQIDDFAGGCAAFFSRRGPHKSTANEDAAALLPYDEQSGVLVVADGMGGAAAGETASRLAVGTLRETVALGAAQGELLRTAILNGFEAANEMVRAHGVGAGTTLAAVSVERGSLQGPRDNSGPNYFVRPYHVGDSMIMVVGQRGKIKLQTSAHSPVGFAIQAGLLDEEEAMHHEERHMVSNVIGAAEMRIELGPTISLAPRDTLLLASDGLSDNLHTEEIIQFIRKGRLMDCAQGLANSAADRMQHPQPETPSKPDDLTFIVWRRKS